MLLSVHTNLKDLVAYCDSALTSRFGGATACVRLIDPGNGLYRVEVTDGRILAIVQGPGDDGIGGTDASPEVTEALIPAEEWKAGLALDKKAAKILIGSTGDGQPDVCFSSLTQTRRARLGDGRMPDVNRVIPSKLPLFSVKVDVRYFLTVLRFFKSFCGEDNRTVLMHYYGRNTPIGFSARHAELGQTLDALLVPLVDSGEQVKSA